MINTINGMILDVTEMAINYCKNNCGKYLIPIFLCMLLFSSCNKGVEIVIDNIEESFDASMFRGVTPDVYFDELCNIVGEPNDYLDSGKGDDKEHSPIYYFSEGKILCHWSGSKKYEIGMIEYIPYNNTTIYLSDIVNFSLSNYSITTETKRVRLFQDDVLYFIIELDNLKVVTIHYWLVKKKFGNIAF